jgi:hypothetical protein
MGRSLQTPQNLPPSIQDAENGDSLAVALEPEGKRLGRAEFQRLLRLN